MVYIFSLLGMTSNTHSLLQAIPVTMVDCAVQTEASAQDDPSPAQSDCCAQTNGGVRTDTTSPTGPVTEQHSAPEPVLTVPFPEDMEPGASAPTAPYPPHQHTFKGEFMANRQGRLEVDEPVKELARMGFYKGEPEVPAPVDPETDTIIIPWGTPRARIAIDVSFPSCSLCPDSCTV